MANQMPRYPYVMVRYGTIDWIACCNDAFVCTLVIRVGGGGEGVLTSRFPYPLIQVPAQYLLAPDSLHFWDCKILLNVA